MLHDEIALNGLWVGLKLMEDTVYIIFNNRIIHIFNNLYKDWEDLEFGYDAITKYDNIIMYALAFYRLKCFNVVEQKYGVNTFLS